MEMDLYALFVAITMGVTEAVKRTIPYADRVTPLISLVIGVILSCLGGINMDSVLLGLTVGLSASGLYSGGKDLLPTKK